MANVQLTGHAVERWIERVGLSEDDLKRFLRGHEVRRQVPRWASGGPHHEGKWNAALIGSVWVPWAKRPGWHRLKQVAVLIMRAERGRPIAVTVVWRWHPEHRTKLVDPAEAEVARRFASKLAVLGDLLDADQYRRIEPHSADEMALDYIFARALAGEEDPDVWRARWPTSVDHLESLIRPEGFFARLRRRLRR